MKRAAEFDRPAAALLDAMIWQDLREISAGSGSEFLVESVQLFDERSKQCEFEIDEAYAEADREKLRRAAHALAGSAAMMGALHLHDRAVALEELDDASWDVVAALVVEIHGACERVREVMWGEVA
jgi:HPt (histidine-containing phosphotransfer) domain-containing protein